MIDLNDQTMVQNRNNFQLINKDDIVIESIRKGSFIIDFNVTIRNVNQRGVEWLNQQFIGSYYGNIYGDINTIIQTINIPQGTNVDVPLYLTEIEYRGDGTSNVVTECITTSSSRICTSILSYTVKYEWGCSLTGTILNCSDAGSICDHILVGGAGQCDESYINDTFTELFIDKMIQTFNTFLTDLQNIVTNDIIMNEFLNNNGINTCYGSMGLSTNHYNNIMYGCSNTDPRGGHCDTIINGYSSTAILPFECDRGKTLDHSKYCLGDCTPDICCIDNPTCADSDADGTLDDPHICSDHRNDIDATPEKIICESNSCTDEECCTVILRTCADENAEGPSGTAHDCSDHINALNPSPESILCVKNLMGQRRGDPCTDAECCTGDLKRTCYAEDEAHTGTFCDSHTNDMITPWSAGTGGSTADPVFCANSTCTQSECCTVSPLLTCGNTGSVGSNADPTLFDGCSDPTVDEMLTPTPEDVLCEGGVCTVSECCSGPVKQTCSEANVQTGGTFCDNVVKGLPHNAADIKCTTNSCTIDECCTEDLTCADTDADGWVFKEPGVHDCSTHINNLDLSLAENIICAADPCTDEECCTLVMPTCADANADGTAGDNHDCSTHPNLLSSSPGNIICETDSCTDTECCTLCPVNHYVSGNECIVCGTGYENTSRDDILDGDTTCPAKNCTGNTPPANGTLGDCPLNGTLTHGSSCNKSCDAGFKLSGTSETSCDYGILIDNTVCIPCSDGQYAAEGSTTCDDCPVGQYDDDRNAATACSACGPGKYSGSVVGSTTCDDCPAGTADIDTDPSTPCEDCGDTQYSEAGSTQCEDHATCSGFPGTYLDGASISSPGTCEPLPKCSEWILDENDCMDHDNLISTTPDSITCAAAECTPDECCTVIPPTCANSLADSGIPTVFHCPPDGPNVFTQNPSTVCAGYECTVGECCDQPRGNCSGYDCTESPFYRTKDDVTCIGTICTEQECCTSFCDTDDPKCPSNVCDEDPDSCNQIKCGTSTDPGIWISGLGLGISDNKCDDWYNGCYVNQGLIKTYDPTGGFFDENYYMADRGFFKGISEHESKYATPSGNPIWLYKTAHLEIETLTTGQKILKEYGSNLQYIWIISTKPPPRTCQCETGVAKPIDGYDLTKTKGYIRNESDDNVTFTLDEAIHARTVHNDIDVLGLGEEISDHLECENEDPLSRGRCRAWDLNENQDSHDRIKARVTDTLDGFNYNINIDINAVIAFADSVTPGVGPENLNWIRNEPSMGVELETRIGGGKDGKCENIYDYITIDNDKLHNTIGEDCLTNFIEIDDNEDNNWMGGCDTSRCTLIPTSRRNNLTIRPNPKIEPGKSSNDELREYLINPGTCIPHCEGAEDWSECMDDPVNIEKCNNREKYMVSTIKTKENHHDHLHEFLVKLKSSDDPTITTITLDHIIEAVNIERDPSLGSTSSTEADTLLGEDYIVDIRRISRYGIDDIPIPYQTEYNYSDPLSVLYENKRICETDSDSDNRCKYNGPNYYFSDKYQTEDSSFIITVPDYYEESGENNVIYHDSISNEDGSIGNTGLGRRMLIYPGQERDNIVHAGPVVPAPSCTGTATDTDVTPDCSAVAPETDLTCPAGCTYDAGLNVGTEFDINPKEVRREDFENRYEHSGYADANTPPTANTWTPASGGEKGRCSDNISPDKYSCESVGEGIWLPSEVHEEWRKWLENRDSPLWSITFDGNDPNWRSEIMEIGGENILGIRGKGECVPTHSLCIPGTYETGQREFISNANNLYISPERLYNDTLPDNTDDLGIDHRCVVNCIDPDILCQDGSCGKQGECDELLNVGSEAPPIKLSMINASKSHESDGKVFEDRLSTNPKSDLWIDHRITSKEDCESERNYNQWVEVDNCYEKTTSHGSADYLTLSPDKNRDNCIGTNEIWVDKYRTGPLKYLWDCNQIIASEIELKKQERMKVLEGLALEELYYDEYISKGNFISPPTSFPEEAEDRHRIITEIIDRENNTYFNKVDDKIKVVKADEGYIYFDNVPQKSVGIDCQDTGNCNISPKIDKSTWWRYYHYDDNNSLPRSFSNFKDETSTEYLGTRPRVGCLIEEEDLIGPIEGGEVPFPKDDPLKYSKANDPEENKTGAYPALTEDSEDIVRQLELRHQLDCYMCESDEPVCKGAKICEENFEINKLNNEHQEDLINLCEVEDCTELYDQTTCETNELCKWDDSDSCVSKCTFYSRNEDCKGVFSMWDKIYEGNEDTKRRIIGTEYDELNTAALYFYNEEGGSNWDNHEDILIENTHDGKLINNNSIPNSCEIISNWERDGHSKGEFYGSDPLFSRQHRLNNDIWSNGIWTPRGVIGSSEKYIFEDPEANVVIIDEENVEIDPLWRDRIGYLRASNEGLIGEARQVRHVHATSGEVTSPALIEPDWVNNDDIIYNYEDRCDGNCPWLDLVGSTNREISIKTNPFPLDDKNSWYLDAEYSLFQKEGEVPDYLLYNPSIFEVNPHRMPPLTGTAAAPGCASRIWVENTDDINYLTTILGEYSLNHAGLADVMTGSGGKCIDINTVMRCPDDWQESVSLSGRQEFLENYFDLDPPDIPETPIVFACISKSINSREECLCNDDGYVGEYVVPGVGKEMGMLRYLQVDEKNWWDTKYQDKYNLLPEEYKGITSKSYQEDCCLTDTNKLNKQYTCTPKSGEGEGQFQGYCASLEKEIQDEYNVRKRIAAEYNIPEHHSIYRDLSSRCEKNGVCNFSSSLECPVRGACEGNTIEIIPENVGVSKLCSTQRELNEGNIQSHSLEIHNDEYVFIHENCSYDQGTCGDLGLGCEELTVGPDPKCEPDDCHSSDDDCTGESCNYYPYLDNIGTGQGLWTKDLTDWGREIVELHEKTDIFDINNINTKDSNYLIDIHQRQSYIHTDDEASQLIPDNLYENQKIILKSVDDEIKPNLNRLKTSYSITENTDNKCIYIDRTCANTGASLDNHEEYNCGICSEEGILDETSCIDRGETWTSGNMFLKSDPENIICENDICMAEECCSMYTCSDINATGDNSEEYQCTGYCSDGITMDQSSCVANDDDETWNSQILISDPGAINCENQGCTPEECCNNVTCSNIDGRSNAYDCTGDCSDGYSMDEASCIAKHETWTRTPTPLILRSNPVDINCEGPGCTSEECCIYPRTCLDPDGVGNTHNPYDCLPNLLKDDAMNINCNGGHGQCTDHDCCHGSYTCENTNHTCDSSYRPILRDNDCRTNPCTDEECCIDDDTLPNRLDTCLNGIYLSNFKNSNQRIVDQDIEVPAFRRDYESIWTNYIPHSVVATTGSRKCMDGTFSNFIDNLNIRATSKDLIKTNSSSLDELTDSITSLGISELEKITIRNSIDEINNHVIKLSAGGGEVSRTWTGIDNPTCTAPNNDLILGDNSPPINDWWEVCGDIDDNYWMPSYTTNTGGPSLRMGPKWSNWGCCNDNINGCYQYLIPSNKCSSNFNNPHDVCDSECEYNGRTPTFTNSSECNEVDGSWDGSTCSDYDIICAKVNCISNIVNAEDLCIKDFEGSGECIPKPNINNQECSQINGSWDGSTCSDYELECINTDNLISSTSEGGINSQYGLPSTQFINGRPILYNISNTSYDFQNKGSPNKPGYSIQYETLLPNKTSDFTSLKDYLITNEGIENYKFSIEVLDDNPGICEPICNTCDSTNSEHCHSTCDVLDISLPSLSPGTTSGTSTSLSGIRTASNINNVCVKNKDSSCYNENQQNCTAGCNWNPNTRSGIGLLQMNDLELDLDPPTGETWTPPPTGSKWYIAQKDSDITDGFGNQLTTIRSNNRFVGKMEDDNKIKISYQWAHARASPITAEYGGRARGDAYVQLEFDTNGTPNLIVLSNIKYNLNCTENCNINHYYGPKGKINQVIPDENTANPFEAAKISEESLGGPLIVNIMKDEVDNDTGVQTNGRPPLAEIQYCNGVEGLSEIDTIEEITKLVSKDEIIDYHLTWLITINLDGTDYTGFIIEHDNTIFEDNKINNIKIKWNHTEDIDAMIHDIGNLDEIEWSLQKLKLRDNFNAWTLRSVIMQDKCTGDCTRHQNERDELKRYDSMYGYNVPKSNLKNTINKGECVNINGKTIPNITDKRSCDLMDFFQKKKINNIERMVWMEPGCNLNVDQYFNEDKLTKISQSDMTSKCVDVGGEWINGSCKLQNGANDCHVTQRRKWIEPFKKTPGSYLIGYIEDNNDDACSITDGILNDSCIPNPGKNNWNIRCKDDMSGIINFQKNDFYGAHEDIGQQLMWEDDEGILQPVTTQPLSDFLNQEDLQSGEHSESISTTLWHDQGNVELDVTVPDIMAVGADTFTISGLDSR